MNRVAVCAEKELSPGERRIVATDAGEIGVFNVDGEYYALANDCCHLGGPVCTGKLGQKIVADHTPPGERTTERLTDEVTIACPWHGYEYELATGKHLGVSDISLPVHEVTVKDGTVYVEIDPA